MTLTCFEVVLSGVLVLSSGEPAEPDAARTPTAGEEQARSETAAEVSSEATPAEDPTEGSVDQAVEDVPPADAAQSPEPEASPQPAVMQPAAPAETETPAAGAIGGQGMTPLPTPPPPADPGSIETAAWRGQGWFDVRVDVVVPVAGDRPGRGTVVSAAGRGDAGWRLLPFLGLYTSVATFAHDARTETAVDEFGDEVNITGFGRLVMFDLANVRGFVPVEGRVQPWADVGAGVGIYRPPLRGDADAAGGAKFALGTDFWVGPTFTLSLGADYRLIVIERSLGHTLSFGLSAGIHW